MKSYFDDPKDTKYIIMGTLCRKKVCKKGVFMVKKVIKVLAITITISVTIVKICDRFNGVI